MECKFCFQKDLKPMIAPCRCNGTIKYVHVTCLNKWRQENIRQPSFFRCLICDTKYNIRCTENFKLQQIDHTVVTLYYIITFFISFIYSIIDMSWKEIQIFFNMYLRKNSIFFHWLFIYNFIHQILVYLVSIILFSIISYQINNFFRYWKAMGPVYLWCIFMSSHLIFFKLITDPIFTTNTLTEFCLVCDMFLCFCNIFFYFFYTSYHNVYIEKSPTKVIDFTEN